MPHDQDLEQRPGAVRETQSCGAKQIDGRPSYDATSEQATVSGVVYDTAPGHTYERTAKYDHGDRSIGSTYPLDPDFPGGAPVLAASLSYHRSGKPRRAELSIDGVSRPVISNVAYTYDGLPDTTTYGDGMISGRSPTVSHIRYDVRRRPIHLTTTRSPTGTLTESLSAVSIVQDQRLEWDGASNLCRVDDRRDPDAWPSGHKPYSQDIFHDGLYRVASVFYDYKTRTFDDTSTDWRAEEDRHRTTDPMKADAADMVAAQGAKRVKELNYAHDWLANMTSWEDDARVFYERSIGTILNGQDLTPNATQVNAPATTLRPSALYLAANLLPASTSPTQTDRGGWLEADYGKGGNLLALTVHGQCSHTSGTSCAMPSTGDLTSRRNALRSGCTCSKEQHYVYRWDELNRLHEARRYDRSGGGEWTLAARQRARYDGANQRVVKQTFHVANETHRATLYVFPGDFERRGLVPSSDGLSWVPPADGNTESQYLIAGARVVWQNRDRASGLIDPKQRITFAITNPIQSTSAVVDLVSGELVEAGGFYPNGAREESLSASADVPLEPVGFTGKEADEEVGLTYFGERYLVQRIGRWATPDPLHVHAMGGGEAGNAYHYVSGNLLQARDPMGLNTVWLGGAGEESDTKAYSEPIVSKMEQAGVPRPEYVPVGQKHGKPQNIAWTLANRDQSPSGKGKDSSVLGWIREKASGAGLLGTSDQVTKPALAASNRDGGSRNFVGYSYGSVVAAHSAVKLAQAGQRVDNVVLVGSPISDDSGLYRDLQSNANIGNVLRVNIHDDPASGGIHPSKGHQLNAHFYFIDNHDNQQSALARVVSNLVGGRNLWEGVSCPAGGCRFDLVLNGAKVPPPPPSKPASTSQPTPNAATSAGASAPAGSAHAAPREP